MFRLPTDEEKSKGQDLIGTLVEIFWDGDNVFYQGKIVGYNQEDSTFDVVYEGDETGQVYKEDLNSVLWKVWRGTAEEFAAKSSIMTNTAKNTSSSGSSKPTYSTMVIEALAALNERGGSSLVAIRKYISTHYELRKQQTASFNNLTLKAVNKAVADREVEKDKNSYKLTNLGKEKRKDRLRGPRNAKKGQALSPASRRKNLNKSTGGVRTDDENFAMSFYGTAAEYNKALRKELISVRNRRDKFLLQNFDLINPFLPEKNYFSKKEQHEEGKKKEKIFKKQLIQLQQNQTQEQKQLIQLQQQQIQETQLQQQRQQQELQLQHAQQQQYFQIQLQQQQVSPQDTLHHQQRLLQQQQEVKSQLQLQQEQFQLQLQGQHQQQLSSLLEKQEADREKLLEQQKIEAEKGDAPPEENEDSPEDQQQIHSFNPPQSSSSSTGKEDVGLKQGLIAPQVGVEEVLDEVGDQKLLQKALQGVSMVPQPPTLTAKLHPHQVEGISWMVHMFQQGMPMILADQMGLGKTLQSIGFLSVLHYTLRKKGPYLIVVPLSVLSNWMTEFERFCPSLRTVRMHGPKSERNRIKVEELRDLSEFDVVITTFEILVSEANFFRRKFVWTAVIVDEGHRLKNEKSQLSEKLRGVPTLSKVILTGTPMQNNLKELWALLFFLSPDVFTTSDSFEEGFDLAKGQVDSNILRQARKLLSVFMLRRLKEHISLSLPSRKELTLLVPLTNQQISLYKQLLCALDRDTVEVVMKSESENPKTENKTNGVEAGDNCVEGEKKKSESAGGDADWRKLMNLLLQLRKVCNHTYLMPEIAPEPYEVTEDIVSGSGKLLMLDRMLPLLQTDGHRVLIFSQFTSMLDILEDYCELRDYSYVRLDGETNRVKRRLDVRRFNAPNSQIFIFLISTRAGGLGLNLASADTVILYDSDWNPQVDLQAMERAHRIGQTKPVRVFRLVCSGSVEERMVSRAEKKLFLNAMVAETDPDENTNDVLEAETDVLPEDAAELALDATEEAANRERLLRRALGVGGSGISKGELASLIRFGANAVVQHDATGDSVMSQAKLEQLLERQGRDLPSTSIPETENPLKTENETEKSDEFEKAQEAVRARMESLQEVDLRQLGDTFYEKKKKSKKSGEVGSLGGEGQDGLIFEKRNRKERIVMVHGTGSGYGGAVPMLANLLENETAPAEEEPQRHRGRVWSHVDFCLLCARKQRKKDPPPPERKGKGKKKARTELDPEKDKESDFLSCAHCPFAFHNKCAEECGLVKKGKNSSVGGMFICPHHKCAICYRSTAAAGGLLFRCVGCLTSFCEDCLPDEDAIDSVGRFKPLQQLGYDSKQSYYIKCSVCCKTDGNNPIGMLNQQQKQPKPEEMDTTQLKDNQVQVQGDAPIEVNNCVQDDMQVDEDDTELSFTAKPPPLDEEIEENDDKEEESTSELLETQLMRLTWEEKPQTPPPTPPPAKPSKKPNTTKNEKNLSSSKKGKKRKQEDFDSDSESESDTEYPTEILEALRVKVEIPETVDLAVGLGLVMEHPLWNEILKLLEGSEKKDSDIGVGQVEISSVLNKIEMGRYRSVSNFLADLKNILVNVFGKKIKGLKEENQKKIVNKLRDKLLVFLEAHLTPVLTL